ncbi:MAG TPA: hypothetical protein VIC28_13120 [Thermoanaerobaculia bacterium]
MWVCGCPASGKTAIAEAAILPLGFELIDSDAVFEHLLRQYGLSAEIQAPTAADKELARRAAAARRSGQGPKMADWGDPLDYLADKQPPTHGHLYAVAREITRRALVTGREERKSLLIVETGGQADKTLKTNQTLKLAGYKTFLIWVSLRSLEDALRRNYARKAAGGRRLHAAIVERSFTVAQEVRGRLVDAFEPAVFAVDNSEDGGGSLGDRIREVRAVIGDWMAGEGPAGWREP